MQPRFRSQTTGSRMNLFKTSFFSTKRPNGFRQANSSAIDPILYTFDNNQFELETLYSDDDDDDDDDSSLRPRQNPRANVDRGGSVVIVEKPVLPDESIQAFAIRYRVSVRSFISHFSPSIIFSSRFRS